MINNNLTAGEECLKKCGFLLKNTSNVIISRSLSYEVHEYVRYIDDKNIDFDMAITFDPSQSCVELWASNSQTVFLNSMLVNAIQLRSQELCI